MHLKYFQLSLFTIVTLLVKSSLALFLTSNIMFAAQTKSPGFVGSENCQTCHQSQFAGWLDSHHSKAWLLPETQHILGNFDNQTFKSGNKQYRFTRDEEHFYITLDDANGNPKTYPVIYAVGIIPLQQYLLDTGKGRLQVPDIAWDTETKRWFHLYPDEKTEAGNGMHWSGSYKNWNTRCAECHATDFQKNYSPATGHYNSTQSEIGVGCEACHGAGEAHLAWAKKPGDLNTLNWHGIDDKGLLQPYDRSSQSIVNLCSACHSRREPFFADSQPPGSAFHDNYRLSLLTDRMYFPDGQIKDEVYVLGSFLQSKMYQQGVNCLHCHDAHSYQTKLEGNTLCTQCHNPAGREDFPTLPRKMYDSMVHHFHPAESEGAQCVNCHMPARNYMVIDDRRDHSFKIPRPDLSEKIATPNACNQCHRDKSPQWAANEIQQRYPEGRSTRPHFAEVFATARSKPGFSTGLALLELALNRIEPGIIRASAIDHLYRYLPGQKISDKQLQTLLKDDEPLVRSATVKLMRNAYPDRLLNMAVPLLTDKNRTVRMEVTMGLLSTNPGRIPDQSKANFKKAVAELQASLKSRTDYPENQMVLGGLALTMRNLPAASAAFQTAVSMDPQLVPAWRMLIRIAALEGNQDQARKALQKALTHNPGNVVLEDMRKQLD